MSEYDVVFFLGALLGTLVITRVVRLVAFPHASR